MLRLRPHRRRKMPFPHSIPQGLWLPLVTPFRDGRLDEPSARRLVRYCAGKPVDGFILAATTGEGLTLDEDELERFAALCAEELGGGARTKPLYLGLSGSDTDKLIKALRQTAPWPIDGYLIACPYYTRPSQLGLYRHFSALAETASKPILLYNIPYRTGVNLGNAEVLRLAAHANIIGIKDCCAD